MGQLDRITQQPEVMGGKACIRGMRITVGMIVGQIAARHTVDEVLADDPYLEREDIRQALRYAASCHNVRTDPASACADPASACVMDALRASAPIRQAHT
ncbi:MAG: DUF433 domain-containing protein [Gammaproteobacteria bacterium]